VGGLGPGQGHNFGLKCGGTKLVAPKVPRIETPMASRWMRNREGLGQWSNPMIIYEGDVKYGER